MRSYDFAGSGIKLLTSLIIEMDATITVYDLYVNPKRVCLRPATTITITGISTTREHAKWPATGIVVSTIRTRARQAMTHLY